MARPFISRLLETFFRRKWLYLLPLVPFIALGVLTVLSTGPTYRSTAVVRVKLDTVLGQVTSEGGGNQLGAQTPAGFVADDIGQLMRTDDFLTLVTNKVDYSDLNVAPLSDTQLRRAIWATAEGNDLLTVNAATSNGVLSNRLAQAAVASYPEWNIKKSETDSSDATKFLNDQLGPLERKHQDALDAQKLYADQNPFTVDQRPPGVQAELDRLAADVERTRDDVNNAKEAIASADAKGKQSRTEIEQQFDVIDAPSEPTAPEPRRKQDVMTLGLFTILGLLVSGAALVIGTLMDRSVRFSDEIETHLDIPVVATIPDSTAAVRPRIL